MSLDQGGDNLEQEFECYAAVVSIEELLKELGNLMSSDIPTAIKGISAGIEAIKKIRDIALKTQNIELQEGILAVREQLLAAKEALLNSREDTLALKEENNKLKTRVEELEKVPQEKLIFNKLGYYTEDGEGPFCARCYDVDKRKVHLSLMGPLHKCSQCNNSVMR